MDDPIIKKKRVMPDVPTQAASTPSKKKQRAMPSSRIPSCSSEGRTPGPATLQALVHDWVAVGRQQVATMPGGLARLDAFCESELVVTTHYSGTGAAEQAICACKVRDVSTYVRVQYVRTTYVF